MIRFPHFYESAVRADPVDAPSLTVARNGQRDWSALVDAIDSECPLLEADTAAVIAARPQFDSSTPLPINTDALLPQTELSSSAIPFYIAQQRVQWDDQLYGSVFVRQVDPSEQFHSVPVAPRITDTVGCGEEGINFKSLVYGEANIASSVRFDKAGMVADGSGSDEDDLSPFGVPGKKQRRLERDVSGRLLTPAEREAALKEIMAVHKTKRLNAFFTNTLISSTATVKRPDFNPIILVSSLATAPFQIFNIYAFLHDGHYVDPQRGVVDEETGAPIRKRKEISVTVSPGEFLDTERFTSAFRRFDVYDDPSQLTPQQWQHVCAAVVTDEAWQFDEWYPNQPHLKQPSALFSNIRGFLAFFEEDILPQRLREWRVHPVILTRKMTKSGAHISQAIRFWNELYTFLDSHEFFRQYSVTK